MGRWLCSVVVSSLLWASPASAASVVVSRPANPSPELTEALIRLQGELRAVGIEVTTVDARREAPSRGERGAGQSVLERSPDARIEVVSDTETLALAVRVSEAGASTEEVTRVAVQKSRKDAAKTLAIRASEVLRSRLVELELAAVPKAVDSSVPAAASASVDVGVARAPETEPGRDGNERFGLALGAALLTSLDGVGPALLPLVRAEGRLHAWLVTQVTLAGLGSRPTLENDRGSASVAQSYGLLGLCYCPPSSAGISPFLSLAGGALRTALEGRANPPYQGHTTTEWSFLFEVGAGARLRLGGPLSVSLGAHLQLAEPYVSVNFADRTVASSGRPNLLFSASAGVWL
ncbi:MAG: hypothetical protein DIU78_018195 [Pseudomonadota bacterium]